jgi:O-antigen/teichoic acid export membrane protein
MNNYQKFTKNIGIIGLTNSLIFIERIIPLSLITKLLGTENYGIWTQLGVTISLITPLVLLGLPGAIVRFLAAKKDKKEIQEGIYSVLTLIFIFSLIIISLFLIFAGQIANFFQCSPILVKIISFIILFDCLNSILLSVFQTFQAIKKYSLFLLFKTFGGGGLVVAAVFLGYGLLGAVISLLAIGIITFLMLFTIILKRIGIKIPDFSRMKEYLAFSLPRVVSSISYWVVISSDRYLIGFFLGILFVGYYAPAYIIGNTINFLLYPLLFMLPVFLSKSFDENKIGEVKTYLKYSLKYFLIIGIPAVFGLSILSKQLLIIFSTKEIALNSYYVTSFVALSVLFYGLTGIFSQILTVAKKTKIIGTIWAIAALLNLGLNFIFIPKFGILGAAITTLLAYTLAFGLIWHFAFKEIQFEIDWKSIIKSVFVSVLMSLAIFLINPGGIIKTAITIAFAALFYGLLIWLFKGIDQKEINFLKGLLKKE